MEFNGFKDFNDLYSLAQSNKEGVREITIEENDSENDNKIKEDLVLSRREKHACNFSLYAQLFADRPEDPFDEPGELEQEDKIRGHFQIKLSKSTKKRLRRQRKRKLDMGIRPIKQIKKVSQQTLMTNKKHKKKELNILIKKLSKI